MPSGRSPSPGKTSADVSPRDVNVMRNRPSKETTPAGRPARALRLAALVLSALAAGGCASLVDPFLGVPEWQTVRYGDDAPNPALEGVPRITAVQSREYSHYIRSASLGRIVAREERGDWIYYAVATRQVVRPRGADTLGSGRAVAIVYERYRAKQPPELLPESRPRMPGGKGEDRKPKDVRQPGVELPKSVKEKLMPKPPSKEKDGDEKSTPEPKSTLPESPADGN